MDLELATRSNSVARRLDSILTSLRKRRQQDFISAWLLCLPALTLFVIFRFLPLIESFRVSFYDYNFITRAQTFIGLENYIRAFDDPLFLESMKVTIIIAGAMVPMQVVLALALALFVQRQSIGTFIVRSTIFMPVITAMVIAAVLWTMMYHPTNGLLNSFLTSAGFSPVPFLTQPAYAIPSLIVFILWKDVGYSMIFFLAGLQGIPKVYYEALVVDGGNRYHALRYVTLPLLKRTTLFVLIITTISTLRIFTPIYVMTKGGPSGSTRTVVYYIYQLGFVRNEMGYASAISVILLLLILAISIVQLRIGRVDHD
jgi:multiple sugar transport system permease protein